MVAPVQSRSSLQVMRDTVSALMIRELKTRFGSSRLGYFWAVAEPALQASIIAVLFTIIGRTSLSGVPVALFLIVGILPFRGFFKIAVQLSAAIKSNKALFCYRQVLPIDPFITRLLIETATYVIVYIVLFLIMGWVGFSVVPEKPLELAMVNLIMFAMASGYGLVLCSSALYYEDTTKIVSLITQPLFFLSGVFFAITMVPAQYWHYLTWNPLLHITEISRDAMFSSYETPVGDWGYIITITICLWGLGLSLYWVNRQRFIAT
ncbi:MAG: ABC transporter [Oceanospirillaceae bacterium]|nr:ABC transporter [Oceanospirillaceae bacterium]